MPKRMRTIQRITYNVSQRNFHLFMQELAKSACMAEGLYHTMFFSSHLHDIGYMLDMSSPRISSALNNKCDVM